MNFFLENLSLLPETRVPKEHFKLVFGSGNSDLAKIRPLKVWTSWISPWVPPYGICPHLDLAAPSLASSFSPARSSCRSSRPLPALPPPSSPRTSPSERTERGAEDGGRCSFVLSFSRLSLVGAQVQQSSREPPGSQRRGDAHGGESPRPPRTALPRQRERELP